MPATRARQPMFDATLPVALFDDNLDERGDLLLTDCVTTVLCDDPADLDAALATLDAAQRQGQWIALAANYELGYALEPHLAHLRPTGAPLLRAWCFRHATHVQATDSARQMAQRVAALPEHRRHAGVAALGAELDRDDYCARVERIRHYIDAGDCYQVNFTFSLQGKAYGDPLALYLRLRAAQPVRYGAFIRDETGAILSRSPELFVERSGDRLTCRPMKGTAPRASDPAALAASEKNRAENVMIVDLIRNDLGRLAPSGGVRVERLCEVEAYRSVWQMTSTVVAEPVTATLPAILRALFPCGSITGAPKIRAMEIIHELEAAPRGLYCGALGWIAPSGDFRFSVPIRTLEIDAQHNARMGIGSGIVADSDPPAEWEECLLKARFLASLAPEFGLIETIRVEPAQPDPLPLLDRHLDRLQGSAAHFGIPFERATVERTIRAEAAIHSVTARLRLVLDGSGQLECSSAALDDLPAATPTVVLSPLAIDSTSPLQRHKTTLRAHYDTELERVTRDEHFDALFLNERDELVEGARTSVFLDLGGTQLATPPLESGALDGVFRRKLLDEGRAMEMPLTRAHLQSAKGIYVANALRGLLRVDLAGSTV